MKKLLKGLKAWGKQLINMWYTIVISCGIWTLLIYFWQKGVRTVGFLALNYFSGALLSIDGENIIGGILGRTIILMVFNTFLTSLFMHKGSLKKRIAFAKSDFKKGLKNVNEYIKSFLLFRTKCSDVYFAAVLGLGVSIIWNTFISGNGAFINTFSSIALFIILLRQFGTKGGFFIALTNLGARKLGYKNICGDSANAFISGSLTGCLLTPVLSLFLVLEYSYFIGGIVSVIGLVGLLIAKKSTKCAATVLLLMICATPAVSAYAEAQELVLEVTAGNIVYEDVTGNPLDVVISDVLLNGIESTDETIEVKVGDTCEFKISKEGTGFFNWSVDSVCDVCGMKMLQWYKIPRDEESFIECRMGSRNYKAEINLTLRNEPGISGELSGKIWCDYILVDDTEGYYQACPVCQTDYIERFDPGMYEINHQIGRGQAEIVFSDIKIANGMWGSGYTMCIEPNSPDVKMTVTLDDGENFNLENPELFSFMFDEAVENVLHNKWVAADSSEEIIEVPETEESEEIIPDVYEEEEDDITEEPIDTEETSVVPAVIAIVASVLGAGGFGAAAIPVTAAIESRLGMKKKKGELHVNGNVEIPTVHYEQNEEIVLPANIVGGEELHWLITAIAITPDDSKFVKANVVMTSFSSAEIKLKIQREPEENITTYIEVAAMAFDVTGERYFHETMVEVNIEVNADKNV